MWEKKGEGEFWRAGRATVRAVQPLHKYLFRLYHHPSSTYLQYTTTNKAGDTLLPTLFSHSAGLDSGQSDVAA